MVITKRCQAVFKYLFTYAYFHAFQTTTESHMLLKVGVGSSIPGVVANVLDCEIIVSEFEISYHPSYGLNSITSVVHLWINTLYIYIYTNLPAFTVTRKKRKKKRQGQEIKYLESPPGGKRKNIIGQKERKG